MGNLSVNNDRANQIKQYQAPVVTPTGSRHDAGTAEAKPVFTTIKSNANTYTLKILSPIQQEFYATEPKPVETFSDERSTNVGFAIDYDLIENGSNEDLKDTLSSLIESINSGLGGNKLDLLKIELSGADSDSLDIILYTQLFDEHGTYLADQTITIPHEGPHTFSFTIANAQLPIQCTQSLNDNDFAWVRDVVLDGSGFFKRPPGIKPF